MQAAAHSTMPVARTASGLDRIGLGIIKLAEIHAKQETLCATVLIAPAEEVELAENKFESVTSRYKKLWAERRNHELVDKTAKGAMGPASCGTSSRPHSTRHALSS